MISVIAFLIMIGILITIHEFGHFLFARLFGVRVEVFSIGFGPPLIKWKGKETLYQIAVIPLGGYVKMYGEDSMTEPVQGEVDKSAFEDPRSFHAKPRWQKILIAFAGPLFNIVLAVILFASAYMIGIHEPKYLKDPVVVGYVHPGSVAEKAGIKPYDKIVAVDGKPVQNWKEFTLAIGMKAAKSAVVEIDRNGEKLILNIQVPQDITKEPLGISPVIPAKVGQIIKGSPAEKAGLQAGDEIIAFNGKPIRSWFELVDTLSTIKDKKEITLLVKRDGKVFPVKIIPQFNKELNKYVLGITPKMDTTIVKYGFIESFEKAIEKSKELTVAIYNVIKGLITGEVSLKTLGGPIAIAQFSGQALETGLAAFLFSIAFISLQLGYLNLLPIPVLDGGLIAILLIEMIIRRPLPEKAKEYLAYIGFALLGTLMIFVIFNDIMRALS
ncbi:RIP metalloprotease RseP [Persephonella sp.]